MVPTAKQTKRTLSSQADFVFDGRFQGREVSWHCCLVTLASIAQQTRRAPQRQYIEILPPAIPQPRAKPSLQINIGLNVPEINPAVIEKTRIMIRNYKRLEIGRHEYGESYQFELD